MSKRDDLLHHGIDEEHNSRLTPWLMGFVIVLFMAAAVAMYFYGDEVFAAINPTLAVWGVDVAPDAPGMPEYNY